MNFMSGLRNVYRLYFSILRDRNCEGLLASLRNRSSYELQSLDLQYEARSYHFKQPLSTIYNSFGTFQTLNRVCNNNNK